MDTTLLKTEAYIKYTEAYYAFLEHSKVFSEAKALYSVSPTGVETVAMAKKRTTALVAYKAAIAKEEACARAAGIHSRAITKFLESKYRFV
jgi:hypothetical protein